MALRTVTLILDRLRPKVKTLAVVLFDVPKTAGGWLNPGGYRTAEVLHRTSRQPCLRKEHLTRERAAKISRRGAAGGPQGGVPVSLLGGSVSDGKSSTNPDDAAFNLTLLDSPPLPVSLARNLRCAWQERRANPHSQEEAPLPVVDMRPWYRNLPKQIRALLASRKSTPVIFTSRPVAVPDIWQDFPQNPFSWANSMLVHLLVLTMILLPFAIKDVLHPVPIPKKIFNLTPLVFTPPELHGKADATHGGGGSGMRVPRPATRGALPPFSRMQIAPPLAVIPPVPPALSAPATLVGPPELKLPAMKLDMPWGDPYGIAGPASPGPGIGNSIGSGKGTGIGPGGGPGAGPGEEGGCCGGVFSLGGGISEPVPIYSPEPAYSEDARKAKFQGTVLLLIVVDAQGNVRNVRVVKPLGMHLDEEAVRTVSTWKFKPSLRQGVPVSVQVEVEVSFRLF